MVRKNDTEEGSQEQVFCLLSDISADPSDSPLLPWNEVSLDQSPDNSDDTWIEGNVDPAFGAGIRPLETIDPAGKIIFRFNDRIYFVYKKEIETPAQCLERLKRLLSPVIDRIVGQTNRLKSEELVINSWENGTYETPEDFVKRVCREFFEELEPVLETIDLSLNELTPNLIEVHIWEAKFADDDNPAAVLLNGSYSGKDFHFGRVASFESILVKARQSLELIAKKTATRLRQVDYELLETDLKRALSDCGIYGDMPGFGGLMVDTGGECGLKLVDDGKHSQAEVQRVRASHPDAVVVAEQLPGGEGHD